ncbi:unnamed protein product [Auanema sp. JU1783]|nr:unnamed protein product [Auanema sp. JU1783]
MTRQPAVFWAQREQLILLKFEVDEVKLEDLSVTEGNKLHFAGSSHNEKYECTIVLFDEIDVSGIKKVENRVFEITIPKKEAKWWPRLFKENKKVHWLRVDFDKWVDEDDEVADENVPMSDFNLDAFMQQQMGEGGMPGVPDFDGLDDLKDEDGDLPDLESDEKEDK